MAPENRKGALGPDALNLDAITQLISIGALAIALFYIFYQVTRPQGQAVGSQSQKSSSYPTDDISAIRSTLSSWASEGRIVTYGPTVTSTRQQIRIRDPITSETVRLASASVLNTGPNTVYLEVQTPGVGAVTLDANDSLDLDFEKTERPDRLFLYCADGESAAVRIIGKY